ncbi:MAG TPA: winged helix-turn-helix domain-containing protein [Allosphingosinicella sp.]|nr:winged helix-turn-helix domain-containing protein [Allosphingosinicella sp.]
MNTEAQSLDPYEAVLADLCAKREQIDQAIALLKGLRAGGGPARASAQPNDTGIVETAGMFLGMSIVDAAKKLLNIRKRTMGNPEIYKELSAGGLVLTGKDPVNVVGSVLTRRFNEVGDVVKVGRGIWGLKEWYPGRSFKPSGSKPGSAVESDRADETSAAAAEASAFEADLAQPFRSVE